MHDPLHKPPQPDWLPSNYQTLRLQKLDAHIDRLYSIGSKSLDALPTRTTSDYSTFIAREPMHGLLVPAPTEAVQATAALRALYSAHPTHPMLEGLFAPQTKAEALLRTHIGRLPLLSAHIIPQRYFFTHWEGPVTVRDTASSTNEGSALTAYTLQDNANNTLHAVQAGTADLHIGSRILAWEAHPLTNDQRIVLRDVFGPGIYARMGTIAKPLNDDDSESPAAPIDGRPGTSIRRIPHAAIM